MSTNYYNIVLYNNQKYEIDTSSIDEFHINGSSVDLFGYRNSEIILKSDTEENKFRPIYHCEYLACSIISKRFMEVIEPFIKENKDVEFVPVTLNSEKWGAKQYFIMHFRDCIDAINYNNSVIVNNPISYKMIKPALYNEKIKGLSLFFVNAKNGTIVSEDIYNALKKEFVDSIVMDKLIIV